MITLLLRILRLAATAAIATLCLGGGSARAANLYPVSFAIDVFGNLDGALRVPGCAASQELMTGARSEWWLTFGTIDRGASDTPWKAASSAIRCGYGSLPAGVSDRQAPPYIVATLTASAAPESTRLGPDRSLALQITMTIRKLEEWRETGGPRYSESTIKRLVYFPEGGSTIVPLLLASEIERNAFKTHEVLLRIDSTLRLKKTVPMFGALIVTSNVDGAEILLDGGVVGQSSREHEVKVENVPEGEHEIALRDAAGRTTYRLVNVERHRTAMVALRGPNPVQASAPAALVPVGKNSRGFDEFRRGTDGAVVIKVPGTEFLMGNRETERQPFEHIVEVADFLIDKTAVTWRQFKAFAAATGGSLPPDPPYWGILDDHPVVFVTWEEAKSYCEWAGGRLPTEAERELAARGTDRRKYPWGSEPPTPHHAVFRRQWGGPATEPVGKHLPGMSPYGAMDMGGNVWEWVADWYDEKYLEVSPRFDPKGPRTGGARVVRGGSWDSRPDVLSASCRNFGYRAYREGDFGFRCGMDP